MRAFCLRPLLLCFVLVAGCGSSDSNEPPPSTVGAGGADGTAGASAGGSSSGSGGGIGKGGAAGAGTAGTSASGGVGGTGKGGHETMMGGAAGSLGGAASAGGSGPHAGASSGGSAGISSLGAGGASDAGAGGQAGVAGSAQAGSPQAGTSQAGGTAGTGSAAGFAGTSGEGGSAMSGVCTAGTGGSAGSAGTGAGGCNASEPPTASDFIAQYCSLFAPTCAALGQGFDQTSCQSFYAAVVADGLGVVYDPKAAGACIADFQCNGSLAYCGAVFRSTGSAALGMPCSSMSDCAASSGQVVACATTENFGSDGTITARICQLDVTSQVGEPCDGNGLVWPPPDTVHRCGTGQICDATQHCHALSGPGDACKSAGDCSSPSLDCVSGTCVWKTGQCGSCVTSAGCAQGLFCDFMGVCRPLAAPGDTCTRSTDCASGLCEAGRCNGGEDGLCLPPPATDASQFEAARTHAFCQQYAACCTANHHAPNVGFCEEIEPTLHAYGSDQPDPADYDATAGAACLVELQNAISDCYTAGTTSSGASPPVTPSACDSVYNKSATAVPGDPCTRSSSCVAPSTGFTECVSGMCVNFVPGKLGDPCSGVVLAEPTFPVCRAIDGLECGSSGHCESMFGAAADGASCAKSNDCQGGRCTGGMCVELVASGGACQGSSDCADGACINGLCATNLSYFGLFLCGP